ncbi:MAG: hypothetical protein JWN04_3837 [Myxococcaceae bacterium]|nr:hypothetical protein [Myxococcaceae bacterium]
MDETRFEWQQAGYAERMAALLASNDADRRADYELSERLGALWATEMGLELDFAVAA